MLEEQTLPKELESSAVVRFQDCDPFRHLNNARYVDYFMNARDDQLVQFYNFNIFGHVQQTNQGWVVNKTHIAYLTPAGVGERVLIRTRLVHMDESHLVVEGLMLDEAGRRLKSVGWVEFTYVSLSSGRPVAHADDLMNLFRAVVVEGAYAADGFNARVDAVKAEVRGRAN